MTNLCRFQANCWFLVSLLHQHLGDTGNGEFAHGKLPNPSLAQTIRDRINKKFNHLPEPLTVWWHPIVMHGAC